MANTTTRRLLIAIHTMAVEFLENGYCYSSDYALSTAWELAERANPEMREDDLWDAEIDINDIEGFHDPFLDCIAEEPEVWLKQE